MPSKRIREAMRLIGDVDVLIDVGTDHAQLPIAMIEAKQAKRVIALDNKQGPYEKALANVAASGHADQIDVLLSDGFDQVGEPADAASILGMGGLAIRAILEKADLTSFRVLVLGPQSEAASLRFWLADHGWTIEDEIFVVDREKHYPILRAVRGTMTLDLVAARYGPILLSRRDPDLFLQIEKELAHLTAAQAHATDRVKSEALARQIQTLRSLLS
jgi:tRNA (adenine22-N1)-methyltransferase